MPNPRSPRRPPPAPQGAAFLRLRDRLVMQLSGEMLAQEKEALRAAQAAAEAKVGGAVPLASADALPCC